MARKLPWNTIRDHRSRSTARGRGVEPCRRFHHATHPVALACIERAGGNPLFLEQLLHNAEEGSEEAVPASIQSLVLARMDRLAQRDRQAFQAAAVIGQRFDLALLRHLVDKPDYVCDGLIGNALVLPEGDDFLFAHALIQEGAYASATSIASPRTAPSGCKVVRGPRLTLHAQHLDRAEDAGRDAYLRAAGAQRAAFHVDAALGWLIAAWRLRRPIPIVTP